MKNCLDCGNSFEVTGRNHKYCKACACIRNKVAIKEWQNKNRIINVGVGKGGSTGFGKDNPYYKNGIALFRRWATEKIKQLDYCCERCGTKIDVSVRGMWAGHHKDHNRQNNIKDNLEVLCKRCHQMEHKCWTAFQGVTTIPKGSTLETMEAHSPETSGDDIVCSA
jgi:hypothetical protein